MIKKNVDVRKAAKDSGVFLWEIADKLGVSEPTLNRWLRKDLRLPLCPLNNQERMEAVTFE